ncbi:MAG: helix-turn-helix transcriptional regulator [Clostridia bacterium]|nr:helix-turn-helix transcriptional regulator [Clostridia bacterium]
MKYEKYQENLRKTRENEAVFAAAQLFLARGVEAVKMTDIAEAAEIGVASLYRYFGTKEAILIRAGILLWSDLRALFEEVLKDADSSRTGREQVAAMLGVYRTLCRDHKSFLLFLEDFDRFILASGVKKSELYEYERSIGDYYPLFEAAYRRGVADGSLRAGVDPALFYRTFTHGITALCQKLLRGEILAQDDFSSSGEVELYLDAALRYLEK